MERFKARLVAQGFTQIPGVDFEVTIAPAARFVTIRHILSLGNGFGWPIEAADVDTAFLYAELDCKIYVKQPEGHEDQEHPGWVWELNKSLYGLRQSAALWFKTLVDYLKTLGFTQLHTDLTVFIRLDGDGL